MNLGMPCLQVGEHPTCDLKELGDTLLPWPCLPWPPAQPTAQGVISGHEWTVGHLPCAWLQQPHGFVSLKVQASEISSPEWEGPNSACLAQTPQHQHQAGDTPGAPVGATCSPCPIPGHAGCLSPWVFALSVFRCHFSGLFPGRAAGAGCGRSPGEEAGSSSFPSI